MWVARPGLQICTPPVQFNLERFHDEAITSGYGNDTGIRCSVDAGADEHDRESKGSP
jgi:hypothetical protein